MKTKLRFLPIWNKTCLKRIITKYRIVINKKLIEIKVYIYYHKIYYLKFKELK